MYHRLIALYLTILLAPIDMARAVPATAACKTVCLASGEQVVIHLVGDEHKHLWLDDGGTPLLPQPDGHWAPAPPAYSDSLRLCWQEDIDKANARRRARRRGNLGEPTAYVGNKRGLVLLIDFPDQKMSDSGTASEFHDFFNRRGYNHYGHIGSVRDYFLDQSYGALTIDFDIVGPLTMSRNMAYYGSNRSINGGDMHVRDMVAEACMMADNKVRFSDYDWDGDGEVDQVFCIYAGYGESAGAPAYTIWPHESHLGNEGSWGEGHLTLDGTIIDTYACSCELAGTTGTTLNGIGTACHEFCHCLGLPDFYDVSHTGGFGMDCWDLMASGSYAGRQGHGEVPYGFSAYERWFAGWLNLTDVSHSQRIDAIPDLGQTPVAYVVRNPQCTEEYFILENHQASRWFSYAYSVEGCHGLMVTHVDHDDVCWHENRVNNNNRHQRMSIIPADASYGELSSGRYRPTDDERCGDLFPGLNGITTISRESHTNVGAVYYQPQPSTPHAMTYVFNDIREVNGHISLCVLNPDSISPPDGIQATQSATGDIRASWNPSREADTYDIELTRVTSIKPFRTATETLTGIKATSYTIAATSQRITRIRLRAVVGGIPSLWSDYTTVHVDAIGRIGSDAAHQRITTLDGTSAHPAHTSGIIITSNGNSARKVAVMRH